MNLELLYGLNFCIESVIIINIQLDQFIQATVNLKPKIILWCIKGLFSSCITLMVSILQGDFEGKALFYGKSAPDTILGCVNIAFSVAAA